MTETSANDSFLDDIGLIAPLYDLDFLAFPREDIDFYKSLGEIYGPKILELGIGTGQIGLALAEAGANVTGVDISAEMLEITASNAQENDIKIELVCQDMLDLKLDSNFGLVCAPMGTIQHCQNIEEVVRMFSTIEQYLAPDGIAVIDADSPNPDDFSPPPLPPIQHWSQFTHLGSDNLPSQVTKTVVIEPEPATSRKHVTWHYDIATIGNNENQVHGAGLLSRVTVEFSLLTITRNEMELAARLANLEIIDTFGDYDLNDYGEGVRLIALLRKNSK